MHFELTTEQRDFAASLESLLAATDTVAATRAWAAGDPAPGLALWQRLAEQGVTALMVDEAHDGVDASPVELVIAFEALGRHCVPGPWIESAAFLPRALTSDVLTELSGGAVATVAVSPHTPYAVDADVATHCYVADGGVLHDAVAGDHLPSLDPARRLHEVSPGEEVVTGHLDEAFNLAALACSAMLLGAGERMLSTSVTYVKERRQFGRPIGSFQAIKHALADVRIALDFARPLVWGAALGEPSLVDRDVSGAKVAAGRAADRAARTALQVHGAIGYTAECDLSLWLLRTRGLQGVWGTEQFHRARILASLVGA